MKRYPKEVKEFVTENHVGIGPKDMAETLNGKFGTNYTKKKMKAYYRNHKINSGLDGKFKRGNNPWNKGLKGVTTGGVQTQFKRGEKPANWVAVGSERINAQGYVDVKIMDGKKQKNWKAKHRILWEKNNGSIPNGGAIIFGDGCKHNIQIDNLIFVSRDQLAVMNNKKLIKKDADLTRTAVIIADLYLKTSERKNNVKQ